jgi:hypothetical protein
MPRISNCNTPVTGDSAVKKTTAKVKTGVQRMDFFMVEVMQCWLLKSTVLTLIVFRCAGVSQTVRCL